MKRLLSKVFRIALLLVLSAHAQTGERFYLVESVPVETQLGLEKTERTLPVWLDMIQQARHRIDIEIFYLSNQPGEPLEKVVQALRQAAKRGVSIRILVDGRFYTIYPTTLDSLNRLEGITVRVQRFWNQLGGVQHTKFFVVDDEEVFLGSQNFDWRALKHIHELGIRLRHPRLARLFSALFHFDWQLAAHASPRWPDSLPAISASQPDSFRWQGEIVTFYPTASPAMPTLLPPGWTSDEDALMALIHTARHEICIQLLTYSPVHKNAYYSSLEVALRGAAARGVKVQLLVSNWNLRTPEVEYLKSLQTVPNIDVRFSALPAYSGGFIPYARVEHCKYMVVDGQKTWLGTGNWGYNYFHLSRNVGIVLVSQKVSRLVRAIFQKSWESPYAHPLDPCQKYQPPRIAP